MGLAPTTLRVMVGRRWRQVKPALGVVSIHVMHAARPHRWQNRGRGEECIFATTRCADWTDCFHTATQKDAMCRSLISDCQHYKAGLHAFVVMSNHIHLVCNVPANMTASTLMQRIKTNSSKIIQPLLEPWQLEALSTQQGLSNRRMWHTRFHSLVLESALMFDIRINYTEQNPVRANLVSKAEKYRWSSLHLVAQGLCDGHGDLDVERALMFYS